MKTDTIKSVKCIFSFQLMPTKSLYTVLVISVIFINLANANWKDQNLLINHWFSAQVHTELSEAIKKIILDNLSAFQDPQWVKTFQTDLNQPMNSKRTVKQVSARNVEILFQIFKIKNPNCDKNSDGIVKDKQLRCLDKIWKYLVPAR